MASCTPGRRPHRGTTAGARGRGRTGRPVPGTAEPRAACEGGTGAGDRGVRGGDGARVPQKRLCAAAGEGGGGGGGAKGSAEPAGTWPARPRLGPGEGEGAPSLPASPSLQTSPGKGRQLPGTAQRGGGGRGGPGGPLRSAPLQSTQRVTALQVLGWMEPPSRKAAPLPRDQRGGCQPNRGVGQNCLSTLGAGRMPCVIIQFPPTHDNTAPKRAGGSCQLLMILLRVGFPRECLTGTALLFSGEAASPASLTQPSINSSLLFCASAAPDRPAELTAPFS